MIINIINREDIKNIIKNQFIKIKISIIKINLIDLIDLLGKNIKEEDLEDIKILQKTEKRFRFKRKFRRRRYIKPLQGENNNKIKDCKCWNCNEKGHYANKCPKLKQKGVKYVDNTEFIMNLEYIREEDNNWYNDDEFYISETEPEDIKYMEEMSNSSEIESE